MYKFIDPTLPSDAQVGTIHNASVRDNIAGLERCAVIGGGHFWFAEITDGNLYKPLEIVHKKHIMTPGTVNVDTGHWVKAVYTWDDDPQSTTYRMASSVSYYVSDDFGAAYSFFGRQYLNINKGTIDGIKWGWEGVY